MAVGAETEGLKTTDEAVGGSYEETLTGLRAQEIVVKGTFRLEKVVKGAELVVQTDDGGGESEWDEGDE